MESYLSQIVFPRVCGVGSFQRQNTSLFCEFGGLKLGTKWQWVGWGGLDSYDIWRAGKPWKVSNNHGTVEKKWRHCLKGSDSSYYWRYTHVFSLFPMIMGGRINNAKLHKTCFHRNLRVVFTVWLGHIWCWPKGWWVYDGFFPDVRWEDFWPTSDVFCGCWLSD